MDDNGWVLGPKDELLFWVPPDLRPGLLRPNNPWIIGKCIKTELKFSSFVHGESWARCRDETSPHEPILVKPNSDATVRDSWGKSMGKLIDGVSSFFSTSIESVTWDL
jgi:hypothetical protein